MSWWEIITTKSRSLNTVVVRFDSGELRVQAYGLAPDEQPAVLIDHLKNRAYCFGEFSMCKHLLEDHRYEGVARH